MNPKRIVIAGGSGFIGSALAREFLARGREVVVLTRHPRKRADGITEIFWDGESQSDWVKQLDGAEAVINLAGSTVNCPHTPENLRKIVSSRVNSVNAIASAISQVANPPRVWVQASAIGFYGDARDRVCDESAPNGSDSLAKICREWESAGATTKIENTRKVTMRVGFVLGRDGGALPLLARLAKFFLGGAAGGGKQFISWIHLADLTRMFVAAVEDENLSGVFNGVAPAPVTNVEFMRALRRALRRPWSPPVPEFAMRLGARLLGGEASLALASQRCAPRRFSEAGFRFQFPQLAPALEDLCKKI